jgi:L-arabinonolactonase
VAFGGTDMTQLFVTSARENLDSQALAKDPQAGDLFVYQTDTQGIPEPLFNIKQLASSTVF